MTDKRYGYHRYGRHEYEPPERPRGREHPTDKLTPREAFGSGVALTTGEEEGEVPWDFAVDSSGDLAATEGYDELGKDVAFYTAVEASDLLGSRDTANQRAQTSTEIERLVNMDSRLYSAQASVRSGARSRRSRGVDEPIDPNPSLLEIILDAEVEPNQYGRHIIPVPRR